MLRRFFQSALLAGLLAGLIISGVQEVTTTPLIHMAESFEASGGSAGHTHNHGSSGGHTHSHSHGDGWAPSGEIERLFFTTLANVIAGIGFGLVLVAGLSLWNGKSTGRVGLLWGLAGFAVFALAPAAGLAPELPTMNTADLWLRQVWWVGTAAATALGLWLMVFPQARWTTAAGIVAIALPHIIGAPHAHELSRQVPPEIAAQFAATSLATSAVFWLCLGWLAGIFYGHGTETTAQEDATVSV